MPNIRIKDIPTTASASSSTDFLALDGSANGTRKLNAYSPTFGGNLTVSGTGTSSFAGLVKATGNAATSFATELVNGTGSSGTAQYYLTAGNGAGFTAFRLLRGNGASGYEDNGFNADCWTGARFNLNALGGSGGNFIISGGNLTVSGTGTSSVAGNLGIGTTSPASLFETSKDSGYQVLLSEYSNNTNRVDLVFRKSRGSAASPATTQVGDYLGIIDFQGRASSSFTVGAEILSQVEAVGGSVYGNLIFSTNDLGGGGITERMRLTNSGNFLLGTTTDGGQKLQVNGSASFAGSIAGTSAALTLTTTASNSNFRIDAIPSGTATSASAVFYNNSAAGSAQYGRIGMLNGTNNVNMVVGTGANSGVAGSLILQTAGTDALTLDSSQNATFAGKITANGAGSTFKGTATNDNAAAGYVGEFVSSAVVSASAVSLTNATAANITSISLTAGDWDVTGLVQYNFTGATCSFVYHGFSSASASFGAPNSYVQDYRNYTTASVSTHNPSLTFRISLAATTTIYFVTQADFSAGTVAAYGRIQARRVR